jgi:hypothetical protein
MFLSIEISKYFHVPLYGGLTIQKARFVQADR